MVYLSRVSHFCNLRLDESCDSAYDEGKRSNGVKSLSIGTHYCVLDGIMCGQGGWTLAMKSRWDTVGAFVIKSMHL